MLRAQLHSLNIESEETLMLYSQSAGSRQEH